MVVIEMVVGMVVLMVVVGYLWWCSGVNSVGDSLCRVAVVILVVAL